MDSRRHIWQQWARSLHRWGVGGLAAALLEAAGPLTVLGAQAVYLGQPLLSGLDRAGHLEVLAAMLEQPEQTSAFVDTLREASSP